ncbi:MAG: hypothetical protein ABI343_00405 [Burkholderiaceae bacterium]
MPAPTVKVNLCFSMVLGAPEEEKHHDESGRSSARNASFVDASSASRCEGGVAQEERGQRQAAYAAAARD